MNDLETLLTQLAARTNEAQQRWPLLRDDEDEDEDDTAFYAEQLLWFRLDYQPFRSRGSRWRCGYAWRRDESDDWAFFADAATATDAAAGLLRKMHEAIEPRVEEQQ